MNKIELIGKNIKVARKRAKMAQIDLAVHVGIDRAYLSEIENGKRNPTISVLLAIADGLNVSLISLVDGL